jgi:hypothetical protein
LKVWARADRDLHCGLCSASIPRGEPIRVTTVIGVAQKFIRCPECAGEEPPPDLAPLPPPPPTPARLVALTEAMPLRTRGALRAAAQEWTPYKDIDR